MCGKIVTTSKVDHVVYIYIYLPLFLQKTDQTIMAAEVEVEVEATVGSEYPAHYKVMMDKLNEQRQLDQFTDITLIVDGKQAFGVSNLYKFNVKF